MREACAEHVGCVAILDEFRWPSRGGAAVARGGQLGAVGEGHVQVVIELCKWGVGVAEQGAGQDAPAARGGQCAAVTSGSFGYRIQYEVWDRSVEVAGQRGRAGQGALGCCRAWWATRRRDKGHLAVENVL